MENTNQTNRRSKIGIAVKAGIVILLAGVMGRNLYRDITKEKPVEMEGPKPFEMGLVYMDGERREYAGPLEYFARGAEQKIFVDRRPFGSLDGVRVKAYADSGKAYDVPEREAMPGENVAFKILEEYGRRAHPNLQFEMMREAREKEK